MSAPAEDQDEGNVAQNLNVSIDHALEKAVPGSSSSSGHGSRVGGGSGGGAIVQANTRAMPAAAAATRHCLFQRVVD
jgi:hypothetical protein